MQYKNCAELLENFMSDFLPTLWRHNPEALENNEIFNEEDDKVGALDRFANWDKRMRRSFAGTMQELYAKLEFNVDQEASVASPSAPAAWGPTDWTFTVYAIRFVFCQMLTRSEKESFESRPLSIALLDDMEKMMKEADDEYETMKSVRSDEGSPGPSRKRPCPQAPGSRKCAIDCLLTHMLSRRELLRDTPQPERRSRTPVHCLLQRLLVSQREIL